MLVLFEHLHSLSLRFHVDRRTGGIQQIVSNGLLGYRLIVFNGAMVILPLVFSITVAGAVLAGFYPVIFVLILLVMCVVYAVSLLFGIERQTRYQQLANAAYVDAYAEAADSYLNFETIKLFGNEELIRVHLDQTLQRGEADFSQFYRARTLTGLLQAGSLTLGIATTVSVSAMNVLRGSITLGDFVLINAYILQFWAPLEYLGLAYREIKMGLTNVKKMLALLNEGPEVVNQPGAIPLPMGPGELRFKNVNFSYGERLVLRDVSFTISPGQSFAIVGPSGSGKTTLARLAFRFYDLTSGEIFIDDVPISKLTLESLRAAIAIVPQEIVLLNDTLERNIGIGRPGCNRRDIEHAAKLAELHDFAHSLPANYQTVVGERGLKLSSGQKQRVAIARALLKSPRIFIFDEATSSLDNETEQKIQQNLKLASHGVTTLVVAHRLSTISGANGIVVLVDGAIAERGDHNTLLKAGGLYARMWHRQESEETGGKHLLC